MMRRISLLWALAPLLLVLTLHSGCSKKTADEDEDVERPKKRPISGVKTAPPTRVEIKAPLDGVIRGRVVLQGDKPAIAIIDKMAAHTDHAGCLAGKDFEKMDQKWILGEDNGVANVVIFLKAPPGKYFPIKEEDKKRTDKVVLDQPHCAFVPHVTAAFPSYYDGTGLHSSGQEFVVKNSAPFNHNTKWAGDPLKTGNGNQTLLPKTELPLKLVPESNPIQVSCDIHPWMYARVWSFDHPYFAVTKSDGNFEIKNVPTGVEVGLVAWHEAKDFFHGGKDGTKQTFNPGENKLPDLTISAK